MPSWFYLWENGDVSLVSANNKDAAVFMLDEIGEAHPSRLKPIPSGFFVSFSPTEEPPTEESGELGWELEDESESVLRAMGDLEKEARRRQAIPDTLIQPINFLHRLSQDIDSRGHLEDFDLKDELTKQLWKDESPDLTQAAVDLVEAYLKNEGNSLKDLPHDGKALSLVLQDVVDVQRSSIFGEKKGLV